MNNRWHFLQNAFELAIKEREGTAESRVPIEKALSCVILAQRVFKHKLQSTTHLHGAVPVCEAAAPEIIRGRQARLLSDKSTQVSEVF